MFLINIDTQLSIFDNREPTSQLKYIINVLFFLSMKIAYDELIIQMTEYINNGIIRVNAILKDDDSTRISITTNKQTTIAKLKRIIQQQLHELHSINLLVKVIQDSQGFVLSNNSMVGDHLRQNDTIYVQVHKEKMGNNMNLPNNLPDLFLTLRYVNGSVIKRLIESQMQLNPLQVLPEIIHLGFWYSNIETASSLCKLLNKIFTPQSISKYYRQAHQMQNTLLLKLFSFWLCEVKDVFLSFPQTAQELLAILYKFSLNQDYAQLLKTHKVIKSVLQISKDSYAKPQMKRMAMQIIRNVSGKGIGKAQSSYIPTALGQSLVQLTNIDEVLQNLTSSHQQTKLTALKQLSQLPKLVSQATVRFDYYWKLTSLFDFRTIKDKGSAKIFSKVLKQVTIQTSKEKACEIMQKDIIKKIHTFLLDSHTDTHSTIFQYYNLIAKQSASRGVFNIQQASQVLASPYSSFQRITADSLAEMSDRKASPIRFLPSIKQYIKIALKTQDQQVSTSLMKLISNLTLDQQCRYQIVNLKGVQVLIKFLQIGERNNYSEMQRHCAKGLLNLSIGSREVKGRILGSLNSILQSCYKGTLDAIAINYIQTILKAPKS